MNAITTRHYLDVQSENLPTLFYHILYEYVDWADIIRGNEDIFADEIDPEDYDSEMLQVLESQIHKRLKDSTKVQWKSYTGEMLSPKEIIAQLYLKEAGVKEDESLIVKIW